MFHPPAADVQDLPGDVVGFFRGEKIHRRSDILCGGRPSNGKARITNAARFAEGKLFFINIRRIDDVHGDAVFGFLDCQGTREGYDRGLSRSVRRNLRLAKGALGPDGAHVDQQPPAELADVVHQNVEPAKTLGDRLHEKLGFPRSGDVGLHREALGALGLQLPQRVLRGRLIRTIGDRDARALARQ